MHQYVASIPKIPIPFHRLLKIVALVDDSRAETLLYQQMIERAKTERLKNIRGTP